MLRKLSVLALAAAFLVADGSTAFAQRGGRGGGGGGGGGRGGGWGGNNNHNNGSWGSFGTGVAVGAGLGYGLGGGYGGYGGYRSGYGYPYSSGYYSNGYYAEPGYSSNYVVPSTSYYSGAATSDQGYAAASQPQNTAMIHIIAPPNAKVFFGNQEASNTSPASNERVFVSPPLEPGSNYQYELRAQWMENGQMINRTRTVPVHANDSVNVDFMRGQNQSSSQQPVSDQPTSQQSTSTQVQPQFSQPQQSAPSQIQPSAPVQGQPSATPSDSAPRQLEQGRNLPNQQPQR